MIPSINDYDVRERRAVYEKKLAEYNRLRDTKKRLIAEYNHIYATTGYQDPDLMAKIRSIPWGD